MRLWLITIFVAIEMPNDIVVVVVRFVIFDHQPSSRVKYNQHKFIYNGYTIILIDACRHVSF